MRTDGARLYLRPSPALNDRILAILGRALALYPIKMHAFVFMSNHWHALVTARDARSLAAFLRFVHGNVAKAAQEINGIVGAVWQRRRAEVIPVIGGAAQEDRLRYILLQGTKERLVGSPIEWPGATAVRALAGHETLTGYWVDRAKLREIVRAGRAAHPEEYRTSYPIELAPLPCLERYPATSRTAYVRVLIAEIEREYCCPHLGARRVLSQDPMTRPLAPKNRRAPLVHTKDPQTWAWYRCLVAIFRYRYKERASEHMKCPTIVEHWPADVFLPSMSFVRGELPSMAELMG